MTTEKPHARPPCSQVVKVSCLGSAKKCNGHDDRSYEQGPLFFQVVKVSNMQRLQLATRYRVRHFWVAVCCVLRRAASGWNQQNKVTSEWSPRTAEVISKKCFRQTHTLPHTNPHTHTFIYILLPIVSSRSPAFWSACLPLSVVTACFVAATNFAAAAFYVVTAIGSILSTVKYVAAPAAAALTCMVLTCRMGVIVGIQPVVAEVDGHLVCLHW